MTSKWINTNTRPSVEDIYSFEGYTRRYQLNPESVQVRDAFKKYLLHKIDPHAHLSAKSDFTKFLISELEFFKKNFPEEMTARRAKNLDSLKKAAKKTSANFSEEKNELRSPSLPFKRLKHLAYLVSLTPSEREQLKSLIGISDLNPSNLPNSELFVRGFYQIADYAVQLNLASQLQSNEMFRSHFDETLSAHPFNEAKKEIEKMEQDLAQIPNSSLLKQYLRERGALDREGRLIKAETPLETKQMIDCYLQLLAYVLELDVDPMAAIDLKAWDEKVALIIYNQFLVAVGANPKWKNKLSDVQNSGKSVAEKIVEIRNKLSTEKQVQKLLDSLSLKVESEHLDRFLEDAKLSSLDLGFPTHSTGLFLEEWKAKQTLNALFLEVSDKADIRSKVEDLCRAIGKETPQRSSVYELYSSYVRGFKEICSQLKNPLHVLLAKEAHLNRDIQMLEKLRSKPSPIDTSSGDPKGSPNPSPVSSARTSNESPPLQDSSGFQVFILSKGLESRDNTREYKELLSFAREIYNNLSQNPLQIDVQEWPFDVQEWPFDVKEWPPITKKECFQWLFSSSFIECLGVDLEPEDDENLKKVLISFAWRAKKEMKRLKLPSIYEDMLPSSLASGNLKRLKLIAAEIAYARYCEVNPHDTEPLDFKRKTIFEKIKKTNSHLKKMEDRPRASFFQSYMESLPIVIREIPEKVQESIDSYLGGSHKDGAFYQYLHVNQLTPLLIEADKRLPYLFYLQKQFVKQLVEKACRAPYRNQGGAALSFELKETNLLDLKKLDLIAFLIENSLEVNMDLCSECNFSAAAHKVFIDNVSDPSFDVIANFSKIQELAKQKALLDDLEKRGRHEIINKIILSESREALSCRYEWLRDKIKCIPPSEFMSFFGKCFLNSSSKEVLERHSDYKKYRDEFQKAIKQECFVGSPVRSLYNQEGMIDENGDLIEGISVENTISRINCRLFTQEAFIGINRGIDLIGSKRGKGGWLAILQDANKKMLSALEDGISLTCDIEQVKAEVRKAAEGVSEYNAFSGYLKKLGLESAKERFPSALYRIQLDWESNLIGYFREKVKSMETLDPAGKLVRHQELLESAIKRRNWEEVNQRATAILSIISTFIPNNGHFNLLSEVIGATDSESLKEIGAKLSAIITEDQNKWIQEVTSKVNESCQLRTMFHLEPFMSWVDEPGLPIPEKGFRMETLKVALGKVLSKEFERLKMSPSYNDLIGLAFQSTNTSLWYFLYLELSYMNYQDALKDLKSGGFDSSPLEQLETSQVNDEIKEKLSKLIEYLKNDSTMTLQVKQELSNALGLTHLTDLIRTELNNNKSYKNEDI